MTDSELRWIVLRKFYEKRHEGYFQWPEVDVSDMPDGDYLLRISDQLGEAGLIDWQGVTNGGQTVGGIGKITGFGIDVFEGQQSPPLAITSVKAEDSPAVNPALINLRKFISRLESIATGQVGSQTDAHFAKCVDSLFRFLAENGATYERGRLNDIVAVEATYGAPGPTSADKSSDILPVLRALESEWQDDGVQNPSSKKGAESSKSASIVYAPAGMSKQGDAIFIGHGGSLEWRVLQDFLQNRLGLKWVEITRSRLRDTAGKSDYYNC